MDDIKLYASNNDVDRIQWLKLIKVSPYSNFFQTPECFDFYKSLSFLKPFVLGVSERGVLKGLICGYIVADGNRIKKFFSRRAIIPGSALLAEDISEDALKELLRLSIQILKTRVIYIEFRNYNDYSGYKNLFAKVGFVYNKYLNFHIALSNPESSFMKLNSTKRRDVRISLKNGAEILEITDKGDLKAYYSILEDLYSSKIKLPLFPYEFFFQLINNCSGKVLGVRYEGEIIGGSTFVFSDSGTVYEWFVCGLDGKFKNIYPSTLATWAAIEWASVNGYKRFDMMGAGKPDDGYGVREFKAKFGGELVEHGRFLKITKPILFKIGKTVVNCLKKRK